MEKSDIAIIGAGVIGLAVASAVAQKGRTVVVIEKNTSFGQETSSRNSEVIHSGIYYPTGSLKATTCVEGNRLMYELCTKKQIRHKNTGKYVIAQNAAEVSYLEKLLRQGAANGVEGLRLVDASSFKRDEPHITAYAALYVPSTGIVDTHQFMSTLLRKACARGADVVYGIEVYNIEKTTDGYTIGTVDTSGHKELLSARCCINCAGLQSDVIAAAAGIDIKKCGYVLHYCKGEYFRAVPEKARLVRHLVYPVPDDVSLGVHLTMTLDGGLRLGPNAFYVDRHEANYHVAEGKREQFLSATRPFISLEGKDIFPDTAGIRPKLQGPHDGFRDFVIAHEEDKQLEGFVNLVGIESPGLTASLSIARLAKNFVESLF
jgi:L-2-hydroxyglutarate oxidase LhgO